MTKGELSIYMKHLTLAGTCEGEMEWIGTKKDWEHVEKDLERYEDTRTQTTN